MVSFPDSRKSTLSFSLVEFFGCVEEKSGLGLNDCFAEVKSHNGYNNRHLVTVQGASHPLNSELELL